MTSRVLTIDGRWLAGDEDLLSLAAWLAAGSSAGRSVRLAPDDDLEALIGRQAGLDLIAIDFPKFTDGRGYTLAHSLRTRLGYAGELRAIGEVLIDQVFLLKRVGFTQFALRADQDGQAALAALSRFSEAYQGSAIDPLPIYRRQIRSGAPA